MWNRSGLKKPRTLVAERAYFGFDPDAFQNGVQRLIARVDGSTREMAYVTPPILCADFGVGAAQAEVLFHAFTKGGLLRADKRGQYRVTDRLRNYATARVVAPLQRSRAKSLINEAAARASRINAEWRRNALVIDAIAVSGAYMSRHDKLGELTLWLIVRPRPQVKTRRPRHGGDLAARRQIITAMCALSSFVIVHLVTDRAQVQRPFSVVYQAEEAEEGGDPTRWMRWRDWTLSLSRRFGGRQRRAA
ncbi:MAG TPA: hypothetical protein VGI14_19840 [Casimicrobiaceae bacterium]|jgi:hypothetical protein